MKVILVILVGGEMGNNPMHCEISFKVDRDT